LRIDIPKEALLVGKKKEDTSNVWMKVVGCFRLAQ